MNLLAHLYLSGESEELIVGNFIGDSVKGNGACLYGDGIACGIRLHRIIDAYTDAHPIVRESKLRLRPRYRKYAPVIVDMFYDHFLAANWAAYSAEDLHSFTFRVHAVLSKHSRFFPDRSRQMLPYMISGNWLVKYAQIDGIKRALSGMAKRARFPSGMEHAWLDLQNDYSKYETEFNAFFPLLIAYSCRQFPEISQFIITLQTP